MVKSGGSGVVGMGCSVPGSIDFVVISVGIRRGFRMIDRPEFLLRVSMT